MREILNNTPEKYEKEFESLVVAFDWILGIEDPTGGEEQAEIIGKIYGYGYDCDLPTYLIDDAYDIALGEE